MFIGKVKNLQLDVYQGPGAVTLLGLTRTKGTHMALCIKLLLAKILS